jgi:hypothetical protein
MKVAKTLLCGLGGLTCAAFALNMIFPKAAHALTATLVQVVNTRSSPVPNQDVDQPARNPYQSGCTYNITAYGPAYCSLQPVPANMELVVQDISFRVPGGVPQEGRFTTTAGGALQSSFIPLTQQAPSLYVGNVPMVQYADPLTYPQCYVEPNVVTSPVTLQCTVTGYLVSLP